MLNRRQLLKLGAAAALGGCGASEPDPLQERSLGEEVYRRGARWLWKQQRDDGRFASDVYGLMRGGESLTALVLLCSLNVPGDRFPYPRQAAIRASDWILGKLAESGALGLSGPAPDYPVYATAMALHAFWLLRPPNHGDKSYPMLWWLRGQQLSAENGWEGHPAQGGFPLGSPEPARRQDFGGGMPHVDLSMTRAVVEALAAVGVHGRDPAMVQASAFAAQCRRADGTWVYSPHVGALNKGDGDAGYGTPTADALRLLIASGRPLSELQELAEPLRAMHRVDGNPRVGQGPRAQYAEAMRFYYREGAARVFERVGGPPGWADALIRALASEQDPEGWWQNEAPAQKEDEPLIATALALSALASALRS